MSQRIQGLVFAALGVFSFSDAWRISSTVREGATFDALGPDRYLMVLAALMVLSGIALALAKPVAAKGATNAEPLWPIPDHAAMLIALAGFAVALPLTGFDIACFGFFLAALMWISRWHWIKAVATSAAGVAGLHLIFVTLADVPLPHGLWLE